MNEFDTYKECVARLINWRADYLEFHRHKMNNQFFGGVRPIEFMKYMKVIIAETESKLEQIGKLSEIKRDQK